MKRTPLLRKTPLHPGSKPLKRSPMKRRNANRQARLWAKHYGSEALVAWVQSLGCVVPGCRAERSEAAHAVSKGAGGDYRSLVPLCTHHHRLQHDVGIRTFERRYGLDLRAVAAAVHQRWRAFAG